MPMHMHSAIFIGMLYVKGRSSTIAKVAVRPGMMANTTPIRKPTSKERKFAGKSKVPKPLRTCNNVFMPTS